MNELKTCFKKVDYDLSGLLTYIDIGDIGLPDIQRPFVWSNAKVRDLFDSMYRGFPVGYLLFWANAAVNGVRQIGLDDKQHIIPALLIVDGQQRLTSLYAVLRGKTVLDSNYQQRHIEIAFHPRDGKFEVADAAVRRDPEWISNISEIWSSGRSSRKIVNEFIIKLQARTSLTEEEEESIAHNLDRVFDLLKYPFTALEIAQTVDEEEVADIFVRINSEGVKLNQADFILTLLSVFWDEGRKDLETFSRLSYQAPGPGDPPSPFNHFLQPGPDQLLRVSIAIGFYRGRLKSVYQVLRGKDLDTGEFSPEHRELQFLKLKEAQTKVLNLTYWHQFFGCLIGAGFRSSELISSENTLLYSYSFYLIGKIKYQVSEHILQKLIGRWFYAATLLGRYTGSPESVMDSDLNKIKDLKDGDEFVEVLNKIIEDTLTADFWTITLPNNLENSSARSPELFAYHAAQNQLGAPVLFSQKKISDLLDPALKMKKKATERHHLFPRGWLEKQGIVDLKMINQVANFALLEWPDNLEISDAPPYEYLEQMRNRFSDDDWETMYKFHALQDGWETLPYFEFLDTRRKLMAQVIKLGFEKLK
ncbi:MAG: DUF262 domain-containing protein [bacterium]